MESQQRTVIRDSANRSVIENFVDKIDDPKSLSEAIKKFSARGRNALPRCKITTSVANILKYIQKKDNPTETLEGYRLLLRELHLSTPISALISSQNPEAYLFLLNFLDKKDDIFEDYEKTHLVTQEFPVIVTAIISILATEANSNFLPDCVSTLIKSLVEYREEFDVLAKEVDGSDPDDAKVAPPVAECYPSLPLHAGPENFFADKKKDKGESKNCTKNYPEACGITGGLGHLTCQHRITKGFTAMKNGESPAMFAKPLFKRLPKRVKARRRVFIYDNCCNFHRYVLRRFPWRSRWFLFVVDRHHLCNHTACSSSYDMSQYRYLDKVNSQLCEQRNNSLRKMSTTLAYYEFHNYLRILELFFAYTNLKVKNVITTPSWAKR